MSTWLKVLITPEIEVGKLLGDRCGANCGWGLRSGACLLFNKVREAREPTEDGPWIRLNQCFEAERKYDASEEG